MEFLVPAVHDAGTEQLLAVLDGGIAQVGSDATGS